MRKFAILISLSCITLLHAQQVVPAMSSPVHNPRQIVNTVVTYKVDQNIASIQDSVITTQTEEAGEDSRLFIYGVGSTDALEFDKLSAAGTLSFGAQITSAVFCQAAFNYSGAIMKTQKADSVSLSELYFPDVANAAFSASVEYNVLDSCKKCNPKGNPRHALLFAADAALQNKSVEKDSIAYKLGIFNWNAGLKYRWNYVGLGSLQSSLVVGAFYNRVLVTDNSELYFDQLFNEDISSGNKNIQRYFNGISVLCSFQVSNTIVYARTYTDLARSKDLAFSVGIKQVLKFKSF